MLLSIRETVPTDKNAQLLRDRLCLSRGFSSFIADGWCTYAQSPASCPFTKAASVRRVFLLGELLAGAWSLAALSNPMIASDITQRGLLVGWIAGGTPCEVLLLWLLARS